MDIRNVIETVKARGVSLRLEGDRIKLEAPAEPDAATKALLEGLRDHRDELRVYLAAPACWNCGALATPVSLIDTREKIWVCWECAKSA